MPSPTDPSNPPHADLDVRGAVPPGLFGQLAGIGRDGVVHSVLVRDGRVSYQRRRLRTDAVVHNLVALGGALLAFGDDSPAYELTTDVDTLRRVDLAGHGRTLAAYPKHDPATGELHFIAHDTDGLQAHVVVDAGALTRHSRPIAETPNRIEDLALTRDRVVLVADGFVGDLARTGEARTTWIATGVDAPHPVHAHDAGDAVVLLVLTPSLERWTLYPGTRNIQREVLDPTPRRFAHRGGTDVDGALRIVWTTGDGTVGHHDLATLEPRAPQPAAAPARRPRLRLRRTRGWCDSRHGLARRVRPRHVGLDDRTPCHRSRRHRRPAHRRRFASPGASLATSAAPGSPPHGNDQPANHHQRRRTNHEHHASHRNTHRADLGDRPHGRRAGCRARRITDSEPVWRVVGGSLAAGFVGAIVLTLVVFAGAPEHVIAGSALLAFAGGWAMLAAMSNRFTSQPQRWARVPAAFMAAVGLILLVARPQDQALNTAGWIWPPVVFALAVWIVIQVRGSLTGRVRWLIYPVVASLAVGSVGGMYETAARAHDRARLPGSRNAVRRRRPPPAHELLGVRQPDRRTRERARSDVAQLDPHHRRGEPNVPNLLLRPRRSGLERRRRCPAGRPGRCRGPARLARALRRTRPVPARRPLRRRCLSS